MASCILGVLVLLFAHPHGAEPSVSQQPVCPGKALKAAVTLVWFFPAVHPLVSVQVVTLNKPHVTRIAGKRFLPCVCEDVSLQVVAAPERSVAVIADEVLLDSEGALVVRVNSWENVRHLVFDFVG